ncbi:unnamed protein product [Ectocarpus sp. CCAP 1310/34]|nr:unnamed protein product [Ectocarpus sp. CCAP 1310/34]
MYEAARATDKATCEANIDKIAALNPAAGEYIRLQPRHEWAMYATRGNVVQDQVTSNMSETANNMIGPDPAKLLELLDEGYRLDKVRAAASDERYRVTPPVWAAFSVNPNHKPPLPVDGQAGRRKTKRQTRRKMSNGEYATTSRSYALHLARSNAQGASASASASVAAAACAHANHTANLSQGQPQGSGET